ncbi:hypothetical protein M9458_039541, partial [Cirrhinus mrigala]
MEEYIKEALQHISTTFSYTHPTSRNIIAMSPEYSNAYDPGYVITPERVQMDQRK